MDSDQQVVNKELSLSRVGRVGAEVGLIVAVAMLRHVHMLTDGVPTRNPQPYHSRSCNPNTHDRPLMTVGSTSDGWDVLMTVDCCRSRTARRTLRAGERSGSASRRREANWPRTPRVRYPSSSSSLISSLLHSHVNLEWCDKIKLSNLLLPRKSGNIKSLQLV